MGALANARTRAILDGGAGFTEYFMAVRPAPQGRGVRNGAGVYAAARGAARSQKVLTAFPRRRALVESPP